MQAVRRSLVAIFFCLSLALTAQAQFAQLNVLDPRTSWWKQQGSIEEASLIVRPKGLHFQYDLYLTVSAQGSSFQSNALLEVELLFDLPKEAAFIDSWLWIGDEIIRAELMDAWTASNIYEDIVNRRRDPSILFKRSDERYELRIYPMLKTESRKVRLSYLMPAQWTTEGITGVLPGHILEAARYKPEALKVVTYPTELWQTPHFPNAPNQLFQSYSDTLRGAYKMAGLNPYQWSDQSIAFTVPIQDGMFVNQFAAKEDGWYQLVLMPDALWDDDPRKVLVLLDQEASSSTLPIADIIERTRRALSEHLTPSDSFAVIVSRSVPDRITPDWVPASDAALNDVFGGMGSIVSYSSLPQLLNAGLTFMDEQGEGAMIVVSSATSLGDLNTANGIISELRAGRTRLPPMHIIDAATPVRSYRIGNRWYSNNEYLYLNLAQFSSGSTAISRSPSAFDSALREAISATAQTVDAFDLYVEAEGGYTYGRRSSYDNGSQVYASQPIYQVGRFRGTPSFRIRASGLQGNQPFLREFAMQAPEVAAGDSTLRTYWYAHQLRGLEATAQNDNNLTAQAVQLSLAERILSRYTAFLALEPAQGGTICATCYDESAQLPVQAEDSEIVGDVSVKVYPNPFRDAVTLTVRLREAAPAESVTAAVYDVLGRRLRVLAPEASGVATEHTFRWDGTDERGGSLASGTYLISVTTPAGSRSIPVARVQ